jgi:geranylgeranyl transferase type-2 subunit beta
MLMSRHVWRTPRTRRPHPRHTFRHPDPGYSRRFGPGADGTHRAMQVYSLPSLRPLRPYIHRLHPGGLHANDIVLLSLVRRDGAVAGDSFGETDTRFSYILIQALTLLGRLDELDKLHGGRGRELVVENIRKSMNFDGGFGTEPGAESHGGQGA